MVKYLVLSYVWIHIHLEKTLKHITRIKPKILKLELEYYIYLTSITDKSADLISTPCDFIHHFNPLHMLVEGLA